MYVFLSDNPIFPCNYADSGFIDKDYQHEVTGNLGIVWNNKFRKLFT